jgi:16S rRNA (uracil1498-N3)-methyltransferase
MKEERYFFCPDAEHESQLPKEEAEHATRVLRLKEGDAIVLIDGKGTFYKAEIISANRNSCTYNIQDVLPQQRLWKGHLHLAVAPTKMNERMEWLAEKATEIGFDELSFLDCQFSERRSIKRERFGRIVVAAMKQSRKAWLPRINDLVHFNTPLAQDSRGKKFIAHCYEEPELQPQGKPFLLDALKGWDGPVTVMIGPEGDFSVEEVKAAVQAGYQPVSLGRSRLRTETAALVAVHLMNINATLSH